MNVPSYLICYLPLLHPLTMHLSIQTFIEYLLYLCKRKKTLQMLWLRVGYPIIFKATTALKTLKGYIEEKQPQVLAFVL